LLPTSQEDDVPTIELHPTETAPPAKPAPPPTFVAAPDTQKLPLFPPAATVPRRRPRSKKWLVAGVAAIALAALAWYFYAGRAGKTSYTLATVDRGDIDSTITATGNCNAVVTVQVGSQVSGNILALYADFNTKVKQGQLVARIDPALFQARVDQSTANLESAKSSVVTANATVKKAESDIASAQANVANQNANIVHAQSAVTDAKTKNARRIELVRQGIIAQEDADTAQATYDQAVAGLDAAKAGLVASQAAVESAQAQREVTQTQLAGAEAQVRQNTAALQQAQLDLNHTQITAPVDGTVVSRNMDVGQTVAASFQAPTIFLIAQDLTKMQVDTNVDESDVGPVRVGQRANFTVDAYPGVIFPAAVAQIRQAPINVQNVITYDVVVAVTNQDLKLFPGMTANVKILTGRAPNAVRIPVAALRFRPAATAAQPAKATRPAKPSSLPALQTVYTLDASGAPKPVQVKLGLSDGTYLEVVSGLSEGQRVIVGSVSKSAPAAAAPAAGTRRIGF
jgi:HlyD family secretion protein